MVVPEEDEDGNQGPVQKDISAVPSKRSRYSLADLLGPTYAIDLQRNGKLQRTRQRRRFQDTKRKLPCRLVLSIHWTGGKGIRASILSCHTWQRNTCVSRGVVCLQRECSLLQGILLQLRGVHLPHAHYPKSK